MRDRKGVWLNERWVLSQRLESRPYDVGLFLQRAICHKKLGYPDLGASDAYRALLLTDEILDEDGEYHDQALQAVNEVSGNLEGRSGSCCSEEVVDSDQGLAEKSDEKIWDSKHRDSSEGPRYKVIAQEYARHSYEILVRTLTQCGDLKSAFDFSDRGLRAFSGDEKLQLLRKKVLERHIHEQLCINPIWDQASFDPRSDLAGIGCARREIYPWNDHEPDRFSAENLSYINMELDKYASRCEVRSMNLPLLSKDDSRHATLSTVKQLGLFAKSAIAPNETLLLEPSVLTSSTRLHEPFCDACSSRLPPISSESPLPVCGNCDDTVFCSDACHERAQSLYHPAICGITNFDVAARDPSPFASTNALYTLLVARTIAMAETQNIHPLDLPQIRFLWGDFNSSSSSSSPAFNKRTLPFSFENNIQAPLHLLTSLSLDLFAPDTLARYDTWVINTLLAKFRGVANARMNERTGVPEVAGVHWLWALANHSCCPNVKWEWGQGGVMGFVARGKADVVQWAGAEMDKQGGLRKGEEVLNHYCDVGLGVKERREWALGALGGVCVCERCVLEEREVS